MKTLDVIGLKLKDARKIIIESGYCIDSIKVTAPPKYRTESYDDDFIIIRIKFVGEDRVELIICRPL